MIAYFKHFITVTTITIMSIVTCAPNTNTPIITITTQESFNTLIQSSKPTIVKAYSKSCPACNAFKPTFIKAAAELLSLYTFAEVDIYATKWFDEGFDFERIPTTFIFKNGQLITKKEGAITNLNDFKAFLAASVS
jgi:thioredoxin-like negative regulator of GroEL